uniref:Neuronal modulation peptide toxin n=1 Tax=Cotesia flavipes TaxID=89805 RepID=A0A8K1YTM3_COTFL|nr:neuronal modulation peptide toxin [Cotesia flavipes]
MNKSIIILFIAFALLQLVRSDEEKPSADGLSNAAANAMKQGSESVQSAIGQIKGAIGQAKDAAEKGFGQLGGTLSSFNPFGGSKPEAPKEA